MKIIVTGANGQLGTDLTNVLRAAEEVEVYGFGREELDIASFTECREVIGAIQPDVIINAAAYTAVDLAEAESDKAYLINAYGSRNLAVAAEDCGAKICLVSTDYVFDGTNVSPYNEYDNTNPRTIYGKSKRAGEMLVQNLNSKFFIVRTSWLYGMHSNNFVKTMIKLGREREQVTVVHDQVGSPTYTMDLSYFIKDLVQTNNYGIYHASNAGSCSWFEFAKAIFEESGLNTAVIPCTTEEFPRPAPRPRFSVMDNMSIRLNGFSALRPWREALKDFLSEYEYH